MSKYVVGWDASIDSYRVTLRQIVSGIHPSLKTCSFKNAESEAQQSESNIKQLGTSMDTCSSKSNPTESNEHTHHIIKENADTSLSGAPLDASKHASDITCADSHEAAPASSGDTADSATPTLSTGTSTEVQELDSEPEPSKFSDSSPVSELPSPGASDRVQPEIDASFLETPVKSYDLYRATALTPARARGLQFEPDDSSLLDSPVKACNIVRPGAPTPGRARNRYIDDCVSEEDDSFVIQEQLNVDDVFSPTKASSTYQYEPSEQLPPLDRTNLELSTLVIALDVGFSGSISADTTLIRTSVDWLHPFLKPDYEDIPNEYAQLSRKSMDEYLEEAVDVVDSLAIQVTSFPQVNPQDHYLSVENNPHNVDIDLDAIFGGQGVTDLEDDEDVDHSTTGLERGLTTIKPGVSSHEIGEPEDVVAAVSYANDLLECKTHGLPLSKFIPTGEIADNSIRMQFRHRERPYDCWGARLVASEIAYFYFSQGLDFLKGNGLAARQYPVEAGCLQDWFFVQPNSAGVLPYDPRTPKPEHRENTSEQPDGFSTAIFRPSAGRHLNYLGQEVLIPSSTSAAISLFVQLVAARKYPFHPCSREGVILAQANRYLDAVAYNGPLNFEGLQSLQAAHFEDQIAGDVLKVNDHQNSFGNSYDESYVIMDFDDICDRYLIGDRYPSLQRPYQFNYVEHPFTTPKTTSLLLRAPTTFYTKCSPEGLVQHTIIIGGKEAESFRSFSPLWMIESVDEQSQDVACGFFGTDISIKKDELSALIEEDEKEDDPPASVNELVQTNPSSAEPIAEEINDPDNNFEDTAEQERDEQFKPEVENEEYSPLNPIIPGLRAAHEDWHPEEMAEDQALRHLDDLLLRAFGDLDASAMDGDDMKASHEVPPVKDSKSAPDHHCFIDEHDHINEDDNQLQSGDSSSEKDSDEEKQCSSRATTPPSPVASTSSSLSLSPVSTTYECSPCIVGAIEKGANPGPIDEPMVPGSIKEPAEKDLSKYASTYAAIVIGAGIVLSFF